MPLQPPPPLSPRYPQAKRSESPEGFSPPECSFPHQSPHAVPRHARLRPFCLRRCTPTRIAEQQPQSLRQFALHSDHRFILLLLPAGIVRSIVCELSVKSVSSSYSPFYAQGAKLHSTANRIAGSRFATFTFLPQTRFTPTQNSSTEPTKERFDNAASVINGSISLARSVTSP